MTGWPAALWLVRHGESEGNVAHARAFEQHAARLDINVNDIDVPLSDRGRDQASALGTWLRNVDSAERPTAVVASPYIRAQQTAQIALDAAGLTALPIRPDERLRDREQGVLDRLTGSGILEQYPEEAERRAYVGKFWYRPPGGESWSDVALRVRSAIGDIRMDLAGERVLVVCHDVPVILIRYVIEQLTVDEAVALSGQIRNCSVTRYDGKPDGMVLDRFNDTTALDADDDAVVTAND